MTKQYMIDFLTTIDTKLNKGDVYNGGELKGKNIREYNESLSKSDLQDEMRQYGC